MKKAAVIVGFLLLVAGAHYWLTRSPAEKTAPVKTIESTAPDFKNISYEIEGQRVLLHDGSAEQEATPGSAIRITTNYFGNEVKADFNDDGTEDIAFLLTQDGGGSGMFFYVVAALKTADGYQGTNAVFLGDRIAPQTTEYRDGKIIVNYADRKPDEAMSASPSVGVSFELQA